MVLSDIFTMDRKSWKPLIMLVFESTLTLTVMQHLEGLQVTSGVPKACGSQYILCDALQSEVSIFSMGFGHVATQE